MNDGVHGPVDVNVARDVVMDKGKARILLQVGDVSQAARDEIIHGYDVMLVGQHQIA